MPSSSMSTSRATGSYPPGRPILCLDSSSQSDCSATVFISHSSSPTPPLRNSAGMSGYPRWMPVACTHPPPGWSRRSRNSGSAYSFHTAAGSITWPSESMISGRVRASAMRRSFTGCGSTPPLYHGCVRVARWRKVAPVDRRRFGPLAPGEGTRMTTPSESPSGGANLVVVANRLPVRGVDQDGERGWTTSPGGVVSALVPVLRDAHGLWIGWAGDAGDGQAPPREHEGIALRDVAITEDEYDAFYLGFSNATLWPLYHDAIRPA